MDAANADLYIIAIRAIALCLGTMMVLYLGWFVLGI